MQFGDPFFGVKISFQEMTLPLKSAGNENTVNSTLECTKDIGLVEFAGAGQSYDLDIEGIGQPHDAREIGGGKSAIVTGKGDNIRLPVLRFLYGLFRAGSLFNHMLIIL